MAEVGDRLRSGDRDLQRRTVEQAAYRPALRQDPGLKLEAWSGHGLKVLGTCDM